MKTIKQIREELRGINWFVALREWIIAAGCIATWALMYFLGS